MKKRILYALQGTGNGHVARAREIIPILQKLGRVDVWLGGDQSEVNLPVPPKFYVRGFVLKYNKKGGVSFLKSLVGNNYIKIIKDIYNAPVCRYDLIINDFECITAWSAFFKRKRVLQLSHQAAFWEKSTLRPPSVSFLGEFILKYYAKSSAFIGFHFMPDYKKIFPPVIREEVRKLNVSQKNHFTVYLPAYHHDFLIDFFASFYKEEWHVFSKFATEETKVYNVTVKPISNHTFLHSMASSAGVICSAGFETPAEAMHLGKKLAVIPIANQYEQYCNAEALKKENVLVLKKLGKAARPLLREWIKMPQPSPKQYPNFIESLLKEIVENTPKAE